MAYTLVLRPRAFDDIRRIVGHIARHVSAVSAARWHAAIRSAITKLANTPERCPLAEESTDLGMELRELLHGRRRKVYRILFTIDGQTVNIHHVRHAAQDRLTPGDL